MGSKQVWPHEVWFAAHGRQTPAAGSVSMGRHFCPFRHEPLRTQRPRQTPASPSGAQKSSVTHPPAELQLFHEPTSRLGSQAAPSPTLPAGKQTPRLPASVASGTQVPEEGRLLPGVQAARGEAQMVGRQPPSTQLS